MGARDNTLFARADSPQLVMFMESGRDTELRTLRGEYVRTIFPGAAVSDSDDRGLHIVGRDDAGAFRAVAGEPIQRLDLPLEWSAHLALNGPGTRIAATNGRSGQMRILSFDTGAVLLERPCPAAASCFWIAWDLHEPDMVWFIGKTHNGLVRLDLKSDETALVSRSVDLPIRLPAQNAMWQETCKGNGAQLVVMPDAIDLVAAEQPPRRLVTVDGYKPGWPEPRLQPIGSAGFLEGCDYAVFRHRFEYYLVEIATGKIGRLPGVPLRALASSSQASVRAGSVH